MKAKTSFSLKDQLINPETCRRMINLLSHAYPDLNKTQFSKELLKELPKLELKERLHHIKTCLHRYLPDDYPKSLKIILKALPEPLDPKKSDDDFGEFVYCPYSLYVAEYGCEPKHLQRSLKALKEITKRFSAEEAIRFFINAYPDETFTFLSSCLNDKNYHVRRWASEGTRPKLPWAQKLTTEVDRALPFLDALYSDATRYVTRSVANHLNDISKVEPELVIKTLSTWKKEKKQTSSELDYIIRHSLRTLIKQGHPKALALLGFKSPPQIKVQQLKLSPKKVKVGSNLQIDFTILSKTKQGLLIDYIIENPTRKSRKVFKLKQLEANKHEEITLSKSHPFKLMTTRSLHEGKHLLQLQINGVMVGQAEFQLCL